MPAEDRPRIPLRASVLVRLGELFGERRLFAREGSEVLRQQPTLFDTECRELGPALVYAPGES